MIDDLFTIMETRLLKLISLVKNEDFMYNKNNQLYRNCTLKDQKWIEIAEETGLTENQCRTKWKALRDQYMRELRKLTNAHGNSHQIKWKYFEHLNFLKEYVNPRSLKPPKISPTPEVHGKTEVTAPLKINKTLKQEHLKKYKWIEYKKNKPFCTICKKLILNNLKAIETHAETLHRPSISKPNEELQVDQFRIEDFLSFSNPKFELISDCTSEKSENPNELCDEQNMIKKEKTDTEETETLEEIKKLLVNIDKDIDSRNAVKFKPNIQAFGNFIMSNLNEIDDEQILLNAEQKISSICFEMKQNWLTKQDKLLKE